MYINEGINQQNKKSELSGHNFLFMNVQDNFDLIRSGDLQYSGFKFKGDDFNLMEFTQANT